MSSVVNGQYTWKKNTENIVKRFDVDDMQKKMLMQFKVKKKKNMGMWDYLGKGKCM